MASGRCSSTYRGFEVSSPPRSVALLLILQERSMNDKKVRPKQLEDHEPGATRDTVMGALERAARPVKEKGAKKRER